MVIDSSRVKGLGGTCSIDLIHGMGARDSPQPMRDANSLLQAS